LVQGRTTIAIAHRLSTLERADRIVVLNRGRVVEVGAPAELLLKGGAFAELVRAQQQPGAAAVDSLGAKDGEPDVAEPKSPFTPIEQLHLFLREAGELCAKDLHTQKIIRVSPVRAFPLTAPNCAICLVDEKGHEIACIDRIDLLEHAQRSLVEDALRQREFRPTLRSIDDIVAKTTHSEWHVTTDRGARIFCLQDEEQIRLIAGNRAVIVDQEGTRYLIADTRELDPRSRKLLQRFT